MDPSTRRLLSAAVAEMLGIALICFLGCAGTLSGPLGSTVPHMQIALNFGLAVMIAIAVSNVLDNYCTRFRSWLS